MANFVSANLHKQAITGKVNFCEADFGINHMVLGSKRKLNDWDERSAEKNRNHIHFTILFNRHQGESFFTILGNDILMRESSTNKTDRDRREYIIYANLWKSKANQFLINMLTDKSFFTVF